MKNSILEEHRLENSLRQHEQSNYRRYEEELRLTREKLECDKKKQDIMHAAFEKARVEAENEKAKKKQSVYLAHDYEILEKNNNV